VPTLVAVVIEVGTQRAVHLERSAKQIAAAEHFFSGNQVLVVSDAAQGFTDITVVPVMVSFDVLM